MNRFYNLPIEINEIERMSDGWTRNIKKTVSIKDRLAIWDINNENDTSETTQILRHLKNACEIIDTITQEGNSGDFV